MSIFTVNQSDHFQPTDDYYEGPGTGFSENYRATREYRKYVHAGGMYIDNLALEIQPFVDRYEERTGKKVPYGQGRIEPQFEKRDDGTYYLSNENIEFQSLQSTLDFLREEDETVPTLEEIKQRIKKRLPGLQEKYYSTVENQTFFGFLGETLATPISEIGDALYNPASLALFGIGKRAAPGVRGLVHAGIVDGAAAALAVGSQQPGIKYMQERLGIDFNLNQAIADVGGAALGAFGLRVGLQGLGRGIKKVAPSVLARFQTGSREGIEDESVQKILDVLDKESQQDIVDLYKGLKDEGVEMPKEVEGAAQILEREAEITAANVYKDPDSFRSVLEHEKRVDAVTHAMIDESVQVDLPPSSIPVAKQDIHLFDDMNGTLEQLDLDNIQVDAKLFQFKSGGDEFGVTGRLRGEENWSQINSNVVLTYEFEDGRRFIADGHQRLGLAKRIKAADPSQDVRLYSYILKQADGVTVEEARAIAAMKNIAEAEDNKAAQYLDAAKVLRTNPAFASRLNKTSSFVRTARGLTALDNESFQMVVNELVDAAQASLVGQLEKDAGKQLAIMRLLQQQQPENLTQAEAIIRQARETDFSTSTQENLFGTETVVESLFKERAKILDNTLKILRKDKATFENLVRNEQEIVGGGNVLATQSNARRAQIDGQAQQTIQTLASRAGPISQALTDAAKLFKETGKAAPAARQFADAIRAAVERGDIDGISAGAPIRDYEPTAEISEPVTRASAGLNDFDAPDSPAAQAELDRLENEIVEVFGQDAAQNKDLLDTQIDTGRFVVDGDKPSAEMTTVRDLFEEVENDKAMINRLKDCV